MRKDELIVKEVLRYLNVPYLTADQTLKNQIIEAYQDMKSGVTIRKTYQCLDMSLEGNSILLKDVCFGLTSRDLAGILKHSSKLYLMAVTIGNEIDKKISAAQQVDMMKALIYNGCANVMIEEACDDVESEIMEQLEEGQFLTMRYSPGYGDVPLKVQKDVLSVLDTVRKVGISATMAGMLIPLKSVTAFIGVSNIKEGRHKSCAHCLMQERCIYRKRGEQCGN
ncbi:MAG: hypothetical protein RR490_03025 [Niameybacter sp.]